MKTIIPLSLMMMSLAMGSTARGDEPADGKEVWYDASGKVVKVTRAEEPGKSSEAFVPEWKKREQARLARMEAQRRDRSYRSGVQRTRSGYGYPYDSYYPSHGYSYYPYHHGWSCRPYYRSYRPRYYSPYRFRGSYHGKGWSVRVGF